MDAFLKKLIEVALTVKEMAVIQVIILLFQPNHAVERHTPAALGVAHSPHLANGVLPDVYSMKQEGRQVIQQMVNPAISCLFGQLGQFPPDSLEVIKCDARIHIEVGQY